MEPNRKRSPSFQAGFTLVEIMVGLAIGMLATMVIMQVFSVFEAQKRTTTGTADAQTNGGIALYTIGRELQMAGYPLVSIVDSPLKCTTLTVNGAPDPTIPNRLSPVAIADNVAASGVIGGVSDTITIRYGNANMGGIPSRIPTAVVGNKAPVASNFGCRVDDIVIITNGTTCAMTSVTGPTDIATPPVPTVPTPDLTSIWLQNTTAAAADAYLACVGTWNEITYAANNGNLERTAAPGAAVPSVAGIVNLQAQYGVSLTANSNQVTQWVNATGGTWAAPTVADRNRIKAVRIAVVARNAKREPDSITSSPLTVWNGGPTINLSAEERHYRYRVFETIIPLRSMIWAVGAL